MFEMVVKEGLEQFRQYRADTYAHAQMHILLAGVNEKGGQDGKY